MACPPWMLLLGVLMGWGAFLPASPSEIMEGKCGAPNALKNARIAEGSSPEKLRYSCVKNYKRKAGTSNLILCKLDSNTKKYQWTKANLTCIRDPSLPSSTTPMSRGEARTSTPVVPKTTAATTLETGSPPPDGSTTTMAPHSTVGLDRVTSLSPITQSSTWPQETTTTSPALQAMTSKTLKAGNRSTAAPSETITPWKLTDSPSIRIGIPLLAVLFVILLAFLLWWLYFQKQSGSQRQEDLHLSEETPMALMASEDNGQASNPDDSSSSSEGDPVLPSSSTSTG